MNKRLAIGFAILMLSLAFTRGAASQTTAQYTTNGNGGAVDVGIWTMPYSDANGSIDGLNNWAYYGMNYLPLENWSIVPGSPRPLAPYISGTYEQYNSNNTTAIDLELMAMAAAQIDFVVIDLTNDTAANIQSGALSSDNIVLSAATIAGEIAKWNANNGIPAGAGSNWKIRYAIAVSTQASNGNVEQLSEGVYQGFYTNSTFGGSNYYTIDGQGLIVFLGGPGSGSGSGFCSGTCTYASDFYFGSAAAQGAGSWGWIPDSAGTQTDPAELVEQVSPGWFNYHTDSAAWVPRNDGNFYANNWNVVFNHARPRVVFLTALDDWQEAQALWNADTTSPQYIPANQANIYQNGDTSGGGARMPEVWTMPDQFVHNDGYWNYTTAAISYLRGTTSTPPSLPQASPNLAVKGTATSSGTPVWPPAAAIDGNPSSTYSSERNTSANSTEWLQVHLPSNPTFNTVVLMGRPDMPNCFPVSFEIQVWDGTQWLTRVQETNFPQPSIPGEPIAFTWGFSDQTTDVRIVATQLGEDNTGGYFLQLGEFMVLNEGSTATAPVFANWGFEEPAMGTTNYEYDPTAAGWTFTGYAGVLEAGSAFGSYFPPQGIQAGFLQATGSISQSIYLPAGTYCIRFLAAQRVTAGGAQGISVTFDSTNIGTFNPVNSSGSFTPYVTNSFTSLGGSHTITFTGTDYGGGDDTAFIDEIQIFNQ
jgi:hypothetical protein